MRFLWRLLAVLALGLVFSLGAGPALAEVPFAPTGQVTDNAGVLDGSDQTRVEDAISTLQDSNGTQLFVVFVTSFDGMSGAEWSQASFEARNLGTDDILLAVATTDRSDGYYANGELDVSKTDVDDLLSSTVEPHFTDGEWADGAVAMAEGLEPGNGGSVALATVAGIAVVGGGGYVLVRNRKRKKATEASAQAAREREAAEAAARDPYDGIPNEQLNGRASEELLSLDEAVKTSEIDLAYAHSQYGDEPIAGFREALDSSEDELSRAFTIRQELDDDIPEDEPTTRAMLTELLALTGSARARLNSQSQAYAHLRDLEKSAPQALEALVPAAAAVSGRVPRAEQQLRDLQQRYAPAAWAAVADNVTEAKARIDLAAQAIAHGRGEMDAGRPAGAVPAIRGAEDALTQSRTLLDAVGKLTDELAAVGSRFEAVRLETEKDIAEAHALLGRGVDTPGLREQLARAERALASAPQALQGNAGSLPDPLAVVRQLDDADLALEAALEPARDAQQQQQRALAHLDQAMRSASSSVEVAGDFITTRRGAVGPAARTRLAEAERNLDSASRTATADPVSALRMAQRADQLAQQAYTAAQEDVQEYQSGGYGGGGYGGGGYGGGYGGGGYGRRGGGGFGSGFGGGIAGAAIGSILFGGLGGGYGGGFGGGGGGGDFGGGGDGGGGDFGGGGGF